MKALIILLLCGLFLIPVFADNSIADMSAALLKYSYVHYYDTVYIDTTRNRDGSKYSGGTPVMVTA